MALLLSLLKSWPLQQSTRRPEHEPMRRFCKGSGRRFVLEKTGAGCGAPAPARTSPRPCCGGGSAARPHFYPKKPPPPPCVGGGPPPPPPSFTKTVPPPTFTNS